MQIRTQCSSGLKRRTCRAKDLRLPPFHFKRLWYPAETLGILQNFFRLRERKYWQHGDDVNSGIQNDSLLNSIVNNKTTGFENSFFKFETKFLMYLSIKGKVLRARVKRFL